MIGGIGYVTHFIIDALLNPQGTVSLYDSLHVLLLELLVDNFHEEKIWRVVWIFPFTFTVFFYYFVPYYNHTLYINRLMKMYLMVLIVLLTTIFFLYILFYRVAYSMVEKQKMAERTIYLEMQAEQYRHLSFFKLFCFLMPFIKHS